MRVRQSSYALLLLTSDMTGLIGGPNYVPDDLASDRTESETPMGLYTHM